MVQLTRFERLFFKEFVTEVRKFQGKDLGISPKDVECLLLLDNVSVHLLKSILCSKDGKFRCMYFAKKYNITNPAHGLGDSSGNEMNIQPKF